MSYILDKIENYLILNQNMLINIKYPKILN